MSMHVLLFALSVLVFKSTAQNLTDLDTEGEWLQPKWALEIVERSQFDSYFDVRLTSNGTHLNRTVYKTSWEGNPVNYGSKVYALADMSGKPQFHNRILSYKWSNTLVLVQINEQTGTIYFSTANQQLGKIKCRSFWISWFFIFENYLFVGEEGAYDLNVLLENQFLNPEKSFFKYEDIPLSVLDAENSLKIKTECFHQSYYYCSQNFDQPQDIINTNEQSQGKRNSIYLYANVGKTFVDMYHYCLKHESNGTTWCFSKNLIVSKWQPDGIRINLYPILEESAQFYENFKGEKSTEKKKCKRLRRKNGTVKSNIDFVCFLPAFWMFKLI